MTDFTPFGYQITENLGNNIYGGRATYKATRLSDQSPVIIKQFRFVNDSAWEQYKEIEREIKILQSLNHPGIPRYLDHFTIADGMCLLQEYKDARPLSLQRTFTPGKVKDLAIAILEILVYLQKQSPPVIHRDLKPDNILLDTDWNVYLVDFGFSRIGEGSVAMSSVAAGTFGFMPPEQLHNRQLTKSSDLYSLGATIICLILGIKSSEVGVLLDFSTNRLHFQTQMSDLSLDFIKWLEKMVEVNPDQRFVNAETAIKALQPISLNRTPEVRLSSSFLEFQPARNKNKISEFITIENPVPETTLKGELCVAADENDLPCFSNLYSWISGNGFLLRTKPSSCVNSHPWISISPTRFEGNQIRCKITVDTRRLQANKIYTRWLLLHTNAAAKSNPYKINLRVHTASTLSSQTSASCNMSVLPYRYLTLSFISTFLPFFIMWLVAPLNNYLLGKIFVKSLSNIGTVVLAAPFVVVGVAILSLIAALLGWITALLLGEKSTEKFSVWGGAVGAIVAVSSIIAAYFTGTDRDLLEQGSILYWTVFRQSFILAVLFLIGFGAMLITASEAAVKCQHNGIPRWDKIILSRLIPAFGISLGVALMIGFTNPAVMFALSATALPVTKVVLFRTFALLKSRYKRIPKDLIEP
jgi:serine/threonine protein kinase